MNNYRQLSLLVLLAAAFSCQREEQALTGGNAITQISASFAASDKSKTVLSGDEKTVLWSPGDEISVFYNSTAVKFTSLNTEPVNQTIFASGQTLIFGGTEGYSKDYMYAVYPYSPDNAQDEDHLTLTVPSEQQALESSFARGAFPSIGRSKNAEFAFYNVCSGVRFTVCADSITKVTFKGNSDEILSGKVAVCFSEAGTPAVSSVLDGKKEIILSAPEGKTFIPGRWYYMSALPGALAGGFTMTFTAGEKTAVLNTAKSVTLKRSIFGSLDKADSSLLYKQPERTFTIDLTSSETKALIDESGKLVWEDNQPVFISDGKNSQVPALKKISDTRGTVVTTKIKGYPVFSGIPADAFFLEDGKIRCRVASSQSANLSDACIALSGAKTTDEMTMKAAVCLIKFETDTEVDSVKWTSVNGSAIAGDFSVDLSGDEPKLVAVGGTSSTVTAKADTPTKEFYFGVIPFKSKVKAEAYSDGKVCYSATSSEDVDCNAQKSIDVKVVIPVPEPEYVDLGLSVKWATCNIGASRPEEYGRYFAWADTSEGQTWNGTSWSGGGFGKSLPHKQDSNNNLLPEYDAVHILVGGSWRMPTKAECQELIDNTTSVWTTHNDVVGRLFTSTKEGYQDKTLFLPAAGMGTQTSLNDTGVGAIYWTSSFDTYSYKVFAFVNFWGTYTFLDARWGDTGHPLRPVCPK